MRPLLAAIQFLTVLPLPARWNTDDRDLGHSTGYFAIVGLMIGLAVAGLDWVLGQGLPLLPASVFAVIAMLAVSKCLHMDGLADTADGFMSSRTRERMMEIMKDSRVGPMGVIAITGVLLLKVSLVASVDGPLRWRMLILMPLAGRCALMTTMATLSYARPEGGLGTVFAKHVTRRHAVLALIVLVTIGALTAGWMGVAAGLASFAASLLFARYMQSKIGGYTGDTLGAACELAEIIPALVAAVWVQIGL